MLAVFSGSIFATKLLLPREVLLGALVYEEVRIGLEAVDAALELEGRALVRPRERHGALRPEAASRKALEIVLEGAVGVVPHDHAPGRRRFEGGVELRSDLVYLSWYALETPVAGSSQALHSKLESAGVFAADAYRSARAMVTSARR